MDYKIRRGKEKGGPDAISDADRYEGPICNGICTAGGAPGPGGAGRRLLPPVLEYLIVNRTNYTTSTKADFLERSEQSYRPALLTTASHHILCFCTISLRATSF